MTDRRTTLTPLPQPPLMRGKYRIELSHDRYIVCTANELMGYIMDALLALEEPSVTVRLEPDDCEGAKQ